jgi:hypothetical protein
MDERPTQLKNRMKNTQKGAESQEQTHPQSHDTPGASAAPAVAKLCADAEATSAMLAKAGYSQLPVKINGTKEPALLTWEKFQSRLPTDKERAGWFGVHPDTGKKPSRGIAALMGKVSGNAEAIDGDDFETFEPLRKLVEERAPGLWDKLVIVKSPRPGYQLIYRCSVIGRNQKLAWTEIPSDESEKGAYQTDAGDWVKKHCRIETRGEGGYICCVGSHIKTHATKRPYEFLQRDYSQIQEIAPEHRDVLFDCCRSFSTIQLPEQSQDRERRERKSGELLPGDDYNERGDIKALLDKHGWAYARDSRHGEAWRRPGKDEGTSATLFENGNFYVFTPNAPPFEAEQWYTPFWCYVLLEHKGDDKAAVKQLARRGFGKQPKTTEETTAPAESAATVTPQEAVEIASNLPELVKDNPEAVFSPDVVSALVLLKNNDPGTFNRARNVLRHSGAVSLKLVDEKVNERISEQKAQQKEAARARFRLVTQSEEKRQTAGDFLSDAPMPKLIIPNQYRLSDTETSVISYDSGIDGMPIENISVLMHAPVLITGRTQDINGEGEGLRLAWKRAGRWCNFVTDRSVICDSTAIVKTLSNVGFPVNTDNAKGVIRYLAALEAANIAEMPTVKTSSHLGWQGENGEHGFLVGRTLIDPDGLILDPRPIDDGGDWSNVPLTFRGVSRGHNQIAGGYTRTGTLDAWRAIVDRVKHHPVALLALYTSFVPPLLRIFDCPNFTIDFSGVTTGGKTTVQRLAASVWGVPDERRPSAAIAEWENTATWMERASAALSGIPLILNDSKRVKKTEDIGRLIYSVEMGRGKGRGTRAGLDTTETWYTVLISSGEQRLTSYCEGDGGTKMRTLSVYGRPFGLRSTAMDTFLKELKSDLMVNYGTAGLEFVSWLLANRNTWDEWRAEWRRKDKELSQAYQGETAGRLAESAAAIYVAAKIAHSALDLPWDLDEYDPLKELWHSIAAESDDVLGCKRLLSLIASWAHAHEAEFYGRHQMTRVTSRDQYGVKEEQIEEKQPLYGWAGKWEKGDSFKYIAFFPSRFRKLLEEFGVVHPDAMLEELREAGALITDKGRPSFLKKLRFKGESEEDAHGATYFIAIRAEALAPGWEPARSGDSE